MIVKFVTLPETCKPDKQSWADVSNLLKSKIESGFSGKVDFHHIEFMSEEWFNDKQLNEFSEAMEIKFPLIIIENEIFSNGEKVNISKIIKRISEVNR